MASSFIEVDHDTFFRVLGARDAHPNNRGERSDWRDRRTEEVLGTTTLPKGSLDVEADTRYRLREDLVDLRGDGFSTKGVV